MSKELAIKEGGKAGRVERDSVKIGEWFWVTHDDGWSDKKKIVTDLMCVEHVASNHVRFGAYYADGSRYTSTNTVRVPFAELMKYTKPAPEWKDVLNKRMEKIRREIESHTRSLHEEGIKANALPPSDARFVPKAENPLALSLRITDPDVQKRRLVHLQKRIPVVVEKIEVLAQKQAATAKNLMLSELSNLYAMRDKLAVVEDKIFTLEVYAGLQEQVKQIADGAAAKPDEKVAVRQSLLFMDEETLFDYTSGGMDFEKLEDFDDWVVKPENLARVLPEQRGVVAFRVRRHDKDYGTPSNLLEAWTHMELNAENMKTYLLLRNGERVYRIASGVDFSPRLIPLKDEFDKAFTEERTRKHGHWTGGKNNRYIPDEIETTTITPDDLDYDEHAKKLFNHLKQYNRVVVLIQGLLDRSTVFHPHPEINLANESDMAAWLNLVRDEEGALGAGGLSETWEQYRDERNAWLKKGDWIYSRYWDGRKRPHEMDKCPHIIQVKRVRVGNKGDVVPHRSEGYGQHYRTITEGRDEKQCVGVPGVEVEWESEFEVYRRGYSSLNYHVGRGYAEVKRKGHMWIPLTEVLNLSEYALGDYKKFLCDRTQKGAYLKWAPYLLSAEDWKRGQTK